MIVVWLFVHFTYDSPAQGRPVQGHAIWSRTTTYVVIALLFLLIVAIIHLGSAIRSQMNPTAKAKLEQATLKNNQKGNIRNEQKQFLAYTRVQLHKRTHEAYDCNDISEHMKHTTIATT